MRRRPRRAEDSDQADGEFLWLVSLSDLMILLFVFFVTLFSFAFQKLEAKDLRVISQKLTGSSVESPLDEIQARLLQWVVNRQLLDSVSVERKEDALILEIKEQLLFASGDYQLKGESRALVKTIGTALTKVPAPYRIGVEGHTDDVPVKPSERAEDNWDLSVRRARNVMGALQLSEEQVKRTVLLGYADTRPLNPNRDAKGAPIADNQSKNRRVTIRIF